MFSFIFLFANKRMRVKVKILNEICCISVLMGIRSI